MKTSVICFSRKEMGKLAHALLTGEVRRSNGSLFFTHQDEAELAHDEKYRTKWTEEPLDPDDWKAGKILAFVERLWVANQVAYHYQYTDETMNGLDRLEEGDVKDGVYLTGKILYKELCSIRYNLYTNGGSVFLGPKDVEKLDHLVNTLADKLARDD